MCACVCSGRTVDVGARTLHSSHMTFNVSSTAWLPPDKDGLLCCGDKSVVSVADSVGSSTCSLCVLWYLWPCVCWVTVCVCACWVTVCVCVCVCVCALCVAGAVDWSDVRAPPRRVTGLAHWCAHSSRTWQEHHCLRAPSVRPSLANASLPWRVQMECVEVSREGGTVLSSGSDGCVCCSAVCSGLPMAPIASLSPPYHLTMASLLPAAAHWARPLPAALSPSLAPSLPRVRSEPLRMVRGADASLRGTSRPRRSWQRRMLAASPRRRGACPACLAAPCRTTCTWCVADSRLHPDRAAAASPQLLVCAVWLCRS
jgi:hypothetical protein